ncbi:hypothetical protein GCM10027089_12190 [Nocardia thraciensis]
MQCGGESGLAAADDVISKSFGIGDPSQFEGTAGCGGRGGGGRMGRGRPGLTARLHHEAGYRTVGVRVRIGELDGVWRDTGFPGAP